MDKRDNCNFNNGSTLIKESDSNKSFVKKVQSRVSGLLSTSLSKWFGGDDSQKTTTRFRDDEDDDDDEICNIQPPSKRIKMPTTETRNPYVHSFPSSTYTNDNIRTTNYINNTKTLFEPVAGPSGINTNKPNLESSFSKDNLLNGDKDSESGESADGYSSRLRFNHNDSINTPLRREEKTVFTNTSPSTSHNRSLFGDRSSTPQLNTSLSSRRPSFNASTFGSPNFVDRTLSTKRILNSPFYKGRTIYGGASAYSGQKRDAAGRQSIRNQIQVTPVNNKTTGNDASLSETARRILYALEEFHSPLADARKVPPPSKRPRPEGILSKYTGANPYIKDHKIPLALNKELQVPTVPDLLKMKLKERLQDSTVAVRQIATSSKSALNKDDYKLRTEEETHKHSFKMKNKISTTRQQKPVDNQVEEVKLPDIALPITTLPKFDFSLSPPPSSSKQPLITVACNEPPKSVEAKQKKTEEIETVVVESDNEQYKFSNPLVLAENLISIIAINDFKFSDPVFKQKSMMSDVLNFKSPSDGMHLKRKVPSDIPQPAVKLSKGSIEDIFGKKTESSLDKFKPAPETWECSVCLIRNVPEKFKCAACETPKAAAPKLEAPKVSFGNQFKMSTDKWECSVCMVRNSNNDSKCVACANPKAVKDNKINGPIVVCNPPTTTHNSFGDKFKLPSSMWVCPICMIQNKNEVEKCAACETQKPGLKPTVNSNGFGEVFKKKTSEWECSTCMIRNPNDKDACVACETAKPGAKASAKVEKQENIPTFNFGIFPTTKTSATTTAPPVIPSLSSSTTTTSSFTFGIPTPKPTVPSITVEAPKPIKAVEATTPKVDKPVETVKEIKIPEPEKPVAQLEPPKPFAATGFTFGNFSKSKDPAPPKTTEPSKPIIMSPPKSAFAFNATPSVSAPSLKRTLNDKDNAPEAKKEAIAPSPSSIIFSPPKTDANALKPSIFAPQVNLLNQEKNLVFGSVPNKTQASLVTTTTETPAPPSNSFSFKTPQTQPQATPSLPTNLFAFGAKTTSSSLFGNTTTTTQSSIFKFNQPEPTNTQPSFTTNTETQPPTSMFGKPTASIFGVAPKPAFEVPAPTQAPTFGGFGTEIKPTAPPAFGAELKPVVPTAFGGELKPAFGSEIKPTPAISGFGTDIKQPIVPSSGFGSDLKPAPPTFGNEIKPTIFGSTEAKPFTFGTRPNEDTSKPMFSFGPPPAKQPEPAKPVGFNFGSAANQPPAPAAGGFSFSNNTNNNTATPAPAFNFGPTKVEAASPFQSPAPATNIFNTPIQPQTQTLQNGGFNFGSATNTNNNMKTGFNFGATNNQFNATPAAPAPAVPGIFSFGSNPNPVAPVPAAGGFNFGQNAPPAPAFNANLKPNFNFTAGNAPPAFSASTPDNSASMMQQRRRLKAVRRNPR